MPAFAAVNIYRLNQYCTGLSLCNGQGVFKVEARDKLLYGDANLCFFSSEDKDSEFFISNKIFKTIFMAATPYHKHFDTSCVPP